MEMHLGWHFCAFQNGVPVLRDGTPLELGRTYEHRGELTMCLAGYHDSPRVLNALTYAPGTALVRVLASRDLTDVDKHCSRYRLALAVMDVETLLVQFAVRIACCALLAERERGREPDAHSWEVLRVRQRWLRGEATDAELEMAVSAAYSAADSVAYSVADSAARSAACSAACSAARSAARSAADSVAYSVADSAADSVAYSAARSAAEAMVVSMLPEGLVRPAG